MSAEIRDPVPTDNPGAREIGFAVPEIYNASRVLFDNLAKGCGGRLALTGPAGTRGSGELCAEAGRWGNGFKSLGLKRGDRVLLFLDDTPAYPAAFFGAVRAGYVPLLINTLTPPDLLQFYLADSGATVAVADAVFRSRFDAEACKDTSLQTLIIVDGETATPTIYSGSANISENSTHRNDEALLEIKGTPQLAHLYFAEFFRLYEDYRDRAKFRRPPSGTLALAQDAKWIAKYFRPGSPESRARIAMATGVPSA